MTIDKYTKFLLTLIAVGVIGINFYLYDINIIKKAYAISNNVVVSQIEELLEEQTEDILYAIRAVCN